jgi:hypothetical protein
VVIAYRISSAMRAQRVVLLDGARPIVSTHTACSPFLRNAREAEVAS